MSGYKAGQFQPGHKPSNKPKNIGEMRAMAKEYTQAMLHTLVEIAMDRDERGSVRVAAADLVLTRAYGKADSFHYNDDAQGRDINPQELSTNQLTNMLLELKASVPEVTTEQTLELEYIERDET